MTIAEFKLQLKDRGLIAKKRKNREVFDIFGDENVYDPVQYAEIYPLTDIAELLAEKVITEE